MRARTSSVGLATTVVARAAGCLLRSAQRRTGGFLCRSLARGRTGSDGRAGASPGRDPHGAHPAREPPDRRAPVRPHRPPRVHPPRHRRRHVGPAARPDRLGVRREPRGDRAQGPGADRHAAARRHDPRRDPPARRRARPGHGRRPGRAGRARPVRRVPDLVGPRPQGAAAAGRELVADRGRPRLALQDPPGRDVPRRDADGRRGRRLHLQPARGPGRRLERALRLQRRAVQGQHEGGRRHHGGVPARRPERQLPVPGQLGQLQRDHPPEDLRRRLGEDVHRHRPVEALGASGPARA